jgi:hypothetical protein
VKPQKLGLFSSVVIFCLVSYIPDAISQSRFTDDLKVTANYYHGYVLPEYSNFLYVVNAPVRSVSLNFSKTTIGNNSWEKMYNYPEYGFSFFYSTLGNDAIHGREFGILPYFHLNIISRKHFNFFNETGLGFGYVTKRFDPEKNYMNIAVGSHLNMHFNLKFGVNYEAYKKVFLNAGIAFDHFSNGNTRNPNLGINYVTTFTGLSYLIGKETQRQSPGLVPHQGDLSYELIGSLGIKRSRAVIQSELFYASSVTFELKWPVSRAIRLGAGADMFYDTSTETEMRAQNNMDHKGADDFRTGLHLSQEFVYSRLSLILQEGVYLGLTDQVNNKTMYNRGIVRIQVSDRSFIQMAMKSHLHVLDYPELGFGMKWK